MVLRIQVEGLKLPFSVECYPSRLEQLSYTGAYSLEM